MLSEISQTEKDKYCMISLTCGIQKIKQTSEYNKTETDLQRTSGYQWGEGSRRGKIRVGG